MTISLAELLAQREALDIQIRTAQNSKRAEALSEIKGLMSQHRLTLADLNSNPGSKTGSKTGSKVAAKYRDSETGVTWTGRGLKPKWLVAALERGKSLSDFAIQAAPPDEKLLNT